MKKIMSLLVVLAVILAMVPAVFAAEADATFTKITTLDELTSGEYVLVCDTGVAMGQLDGGWILPANPVVDGDTVTDAAGAVWTLTVDGTNVKLTDANGVTVAPKGGNSNGIKEGDYNWTVSCENGVFQFAGQGEDTVIMAGNTDYENKFRGYKSTTVTGQYADKYPAAFTLYKLSDGEEVVTPAGPVACEIPGTMTYTFETDNAASAGVIFQWTANADGELSVARMGENYMTTVMINGNYGEIGNEGYVVKSGDVVEITVYGYGAGTINVPVDFVTAGGQGTAALGTAENPEIIASLSAGVVKSLESGEYYFQYTAAKDGELKIVTEGDGTHNMEAYINGDTTMIYSNWDNDGAFITMNVAAGDVITLKVYFDYPGAGTISFNSDFDAGMTPVPNPGTGDAIFAVLSILAVSGMGITAVASKKR